VSPGPPSLEVGPGNSPGSKAYTETEDERKSSATNTSLIIKGSFLNVVMLYDASMIRFLTKELLVNQKFRICIITLRA